MKLCDLLSEWTSLNTWFINGVSRLHVSQQTIHIWIYCCFCFIVFVSFVFIVLLLLLCHACYCDACKCLHGLGICVWFYPNKLMMMMMKLVFLGTSIYLLRVLRLALVSMWTQPKSCTRFVLAALSSFCATLNHDSVYSLSVKFYSVLYQKNVGDKSSFLSADVLF